MIYGKVSAFIQSGAGVLGEDKDGTDHSVSQDAPVVQVSCTMY